MEQELRARPLLPKDQRQADVLEVEQEQRQEGEGPGDGGEVKGGEELRHRGGQDQRGSPSLAGGVKQRASEDGWTFHHTFPYGDLVTT